MQRYKELFINLNFNKSGAFVPFITIGDPNPIDFMHIIDTLIQSGSDALELGIPFSDPLSDGPLIQKSMQRAFHAGINFKTCFTLLHKIRKKYPNIPIGILIYANLIFKNGIESFYAHCSKSSIDSVLIPDVPIEEISPFYQTAMKHRIAQILICPPNATTQLIQNITNLGNGYIYLLSRPGVTGYDNDATTINNYILNDLVKHIRKYKKNIPILQGFGVYTPKQAQESLLIGTSGIILGSIISDIIEKNLQNTHNLFKQLQTLVHIMKKSMRIL